MAVMFVLCVGVCVVSAAASAVFAMRSRAARDRAEFESHAAQINADRIENALGRVERLNGN